MIRRTFVGVVACVLASSVTIGGQAARAAEATAFTTERLAAAQAADKPVLVEIHAPWCPVCKAQQPILAELAGRPAYAGLTLLRVDFDTQKEAVRQLRATSQSTLIAFKGRTEMQRSVGDTDAASIEELVASAFGG